MSNNDNQTKLNLKKSPKPKSFTLTYGHKFVVGPDHTVNIEMQSEYSGKEDRDECFEDLKDFVLNKAGDEKDQAKFFEEWYARAQVQEQTMKRGGAKIPKEQFFTYPELDKIQWRKSKWERQGDSDLRGRPGEDAWVRLDSLPESLIGWLRDKGEKIPVIIGEEKYILGLKGDFLNRYKYREGKKW